MQAIRSGASNGFSIVGRGAFARLVKRLLEVTFYQLGEHRNVAVDNRLSVRYFGDGAAWQQG